ncbi:MAG: 2-C-methyl-D-erythritol 4-phosphate cytidylyltransferase [Gemmatimonadetes bacterium]|nr:2-C-methyl-D-erythritol 4-phosphate cytidylyltransferase [Gemmatimonadota bacterium]
MTGTSVALLVPAAGSGVRMGGVRKPFLKLAGRSVLDRALAPFLARRDFVEVVVALGSRPDPRDPVFSDARVRATSGGANRFESVANAFDCVESEAEVIAVHDAARPFPPPGAIDACVRLAARGIGAVAGIPAVDTVKRTSGSGVIADTPARETLWYAQTPQVFPRELFARAIEHCRAGGPPPTDDASMVERLGAEVRMVQASVSNIKITSRADLAVAESLIAGGYI